MDSDLVKDVLAEAEHMGFNAGVRKQSSKQLLNEFGFNPTGTSAVASLKRHTEEIQDITAYFEAMTGKSATDAVGHETGPADPDLDMGMYKCFIDELGEKGAADNVRKTKWPAEKNEVLEKRMVSCVANAAQEVRGRVLERSQHLDRKGLYDPTINRARTQAFYKTELLRKLKMAELRQAAVQLVDGGVSTPLTLGVTGKRNGSLDTFQIALDLHIRDRDEELRASKHKLPEKEQPAADSQPRRRSLRGEQETSLTPPKGRSRKRMPSKRVVAGVAAAAVFMETAADSRSQSRRSSQPTAMVVGSEDVTEVVEAVEEVVDADVEEAAPEEDGPPEALQQQNTWEQEMIAKQREDDILKKRRRRRKRMPPAYMEYAKLRQHEMDEADQQAQKVSQWVKDSDKSRMMARAKETGEFDRDQGTVSPFEKVRDDVLLSKGQKERLASEADWQEIAVSPHVVLRTSKLAAAPRIPELVVSAPNYDPVRSGEVDPKWLPMGNSTSQIRELVTSAYTKEASVVVTEHDLLPGAAPVDFAPLQGIMPQMPSNDQEATSHAAQDDGSSTIRATTDTELLAAQSASFVNIAIQRRLEAIWDDLEMPPMDKLDYVLKYGRPDFAHKLEASLAMWEEAAECVTRREKLLRELNNLKNSSSAIKGSKAVGERMQRLAVAVCEQTRDCVRLQDTLLEQYADILKYQGFSYSSKLKRDMDQELISLLPANYVVDDLLLLGNS